MEENNGLAQIPFITHRLQLLEEEKRTHRYKTAFIVTAVLLAASNICWFLCK